MVFIFTNTVYLIIPFMLMAVQVMTYGTREVIDRHMQRNIGDKIRHGLLDKRSVYLFEKGTIALRNIIASGKKVWSRSKTFRRYDKTGDLETALDDFYSFKPDNVQETRTMNDKVVLIHGTIGKRRLRLRVHGDRHSLRRPVLEVIHEDTSIRPYIDRIIYRE